MKQIKTEDCKGNSENKSYKVCPVKRIKIEKYKRPLVKRIDTENCMSPTT